ncbi:unnamed protein product [Brachionus calyciflorus]|uniref:DEP domain-containing protein n=1 Tax=Brachionus calyciflorus TaxID=104777 RepID=A0A813MDW7_9BILA|nr:unnamed protein product [Brachionus calyciflorus]
MSSTNRSQLSGISIATSQPINSQFKHTILWNNILSNLKTQLLESHLTSGHKLKKQHSRFVAASVGGMLLIKQNIIMNTTNTLNSLTSHNHPPASPSKLTNSPLEAIYFTGSQCIDIVYAYLTENKELFQVERQITREKCAKLCQMIMDSGVFESMSTRSIKFDDSSLKYYKFKSEYLKQTEEADIDRFNRTMKTELSDQDDNYHKKVTYDTNDKENMDTKNQLIDTNNNKFSKNDGLGEQTLSAKTNQNTSLLFSKSSRLLNKTNNVNTKLKRKLTSMRRSSTMHALLPSDGINETNQNVDKKVENCLIENAAKPKISNPLIPSVFEMENNYQSLDSENIELGEKNLKVKSLSTSDANMIKSVKLDRTKSIDSASSDMKIKFENKSLSQKLAHELLLTRTITRELIIEKLLSLIDLPIIEHLLTIDEHNDIEYCEALQSFDNAIANNLNSLNLNSDIQTATTTASTDLNKLFNKTSLNYINKSLECLNQTYDLARCDLRDEWRRSALEVLEFIDWQKYQSKSVPNTPSKHQPLINDKNLVLLLMKDLELYNIIKDYYSLKQKSSHHFLHDSFQPLFTNILIFIKKSHYTKALEILNLGTLLLLKQTQAELKRLLKFLYLTANSSHAPRLCDEKPNNSIILNHFSNCLINPKLIAFEESRLLLNFMLNNFDNLFRLTKSIEESINKRRLLAKNGREEALLEQIYCKKLSTKEYKDNSKEETTKALVDLINHIIDDPQISLKHKKLKLKALQRIHPEIYEKYFADLF